MSKIEDKILNYVIKELKDRDVIDIKAYDQIFGCKSWDEVAEGIKKIIG